MQIQGFACYTLILAGISQVICNNTGGVNNGQDGNFAHLMQMFAQYLKPMFQSMQNQATKRASQIAVQAPQAVPPTNPPTPAAVNYKAPVKLQDYSIGVVHRDSDHRKSKSKTKSSQLTLTPWQLEQQREWLRKKKQKERKRKQIKKTQTNQRKNPGVPQRQRTQNSSPLASLNQQQIYQQLMTGKITYEQLLQQRQQQQKRKQQHAQQQKLQEQQRQLRKQQQLRQQQLHQQNLQRKQQLKLQQQQQTLRQQQIWQQQQRHRKKQTVQTQLQNSLSVKSNTPSKAQYQVQQLQAASPNVGTFQYGRAKGDVSTPAPDDVKALNKPQNDKSQVLDNPSWSWMMNPAPAAIRTPSARGGKTVMYLVSNSGAKPRVQYVGPNAGAIRNPPKITYIPPASNGVIRLSSTNIMRQAIGSGAGCPFAGFFLPDPTTRCNYLECVFGPDPWPDQAGNIPLGTVQRPCGVGTAVPVGYTGGTDNPCTSAFSACKVAPVPQPPVVTPPPITVIPGVCTVLGQFLAHPTNRCRYRVCVHSTDPWPNSSGRVPLVALSRRCGPGTAVPADFVGGLRNPCSLKAEECSLSNKKKRAYL